MRLEKLTYELIQVRAIDVPLNRPIVAAVGTFSKTPLILVDITTKEGVVGHGYVAPYLVQSARYIVPAIKDLFEQRVRQDRQSALGFSVRAQISEPDRI